MSISSYSSYKIDHSKFQGKSIFLACIDIRKPHRFEKHVVGSIWVLNRILKYMVSK